MAYNIDVDLNVKSVKGLKEQFTSPVNLISSKLQSVVGNLGNVGGVLSKSIGSISSIGALAGGGASAGAGAGAAGGAAAGLGAIAVPLIAVAGGVMIIVTILKKIADLTLNASAMLKGRLIGIGKILMMFFKPIGDVISNWLIPVFSILKPLLKIWQMLWLPYMKDMAKAMKAGAIQMQAGNWGEAAKDFMIAFADMMGPFVELFIRASGEIAKFFLDAIISAIENLAISLVWILSPLINMFGGNADDIIKKIKESFDNLKGTINSVIDVGVEQAIANWRNNLHQLSVQAEQDAEAIKEQLEAEKKAKEAAEAQKQAQDDLCTGMSIWRGEASSVSDAIDYLTGKTDKLSNPIAYLTGNVKKLDTTTTKAKIPVLDLSKAMTNSTAPTSNLTKKVSLFGQVIRAVSSVIGSAVSYIKSKIREAEEMGSSAHERKHREYQHGGLVPKTGVYMLHGGERVMPTGASSSEAVVMQPTININAEIQHDYDIHDLAEKISREIYSELRLRTKYGGF